MISVSISAAAATRKLGFWTNFGIMARDAPPRPITPTPKTRSLPAISALLSRAARAWHLRVLMTIQARRNCPDLSTAPGTGGDKLLLREVLLIYIRPWFNAFKTFKSFKAIPDCSQRLQRFERSAAIERLEPKIPYITRKPRVSFTRLGRKR